MKNDFSVQNSKYSTLIEEKDNMMTFRTTNKNERTPKIYTERFHQKQTKDDRSHSQELSKSDVYSIPYPLWSKRKSQIYQQK